MNKGIIIILLLFLIPIYSFSQRTTNFSNDPEKFIKELYDFFGNTSKKKEGKELMDAFSALWEAGSFSDEQRKGIYFTSNKLLQKKAMAFPHFESYLNALMIFSQAGKSSEFYENWESILQELLENKKMHVRKAEKYIEITSRLIKDNVIFFSPSVEWVASTDNYSIKYDNGEVKFIFNESFDLVCYAKRDSANLQNTKGVFSLFEEKWKGTNGKITWERAGFSEEELYAHLSGYEIDMSKSHYHADSVKFVNTFYFNKPLLGTLDEKVMTTSSEERASYPRFESYTKRFKIKNIYPEVDFDGGFKMYGARFIGAGDENRLATLNFYRKDTLFLTAQTTTFIFRKEQVVGLNALITVHLDKDSIFHPGLHFKFFPDTRTVILSRDMKGMSRSPYFNTYHNVDMDFAQFTWNMDEPRIVFEMQKGSEYRLARFESSDYFSNDRYFSIQGMDEVNPLFSVRDYSRYIGSEEFYGDDFVMYMRKSAPEVRHVLMTLSYMGFISYNTETDKVVIKQRLYDYLQAFVGKKDYDVISFNSEPKSEQVPNASLNLLNYDLSINGVESIQLSDSQQVLIYPKEQKILLKKDRNFEFDGVVEAGLFTFHGSDFSFEYDKFKINLNNVDALNLRVRTGARDAYGKPVLEDIKSTIENVTGDLLIDNANNKSGMKDYPEYPIFNSKEDSYVYYDKKSKFKSTYSRDKFYFQIYPYSIDSLDNFTKSGINLKGYFVSSGIFPPFEENLVLMPDYSLGFAMKTPPGGFPLYGGKGSFNNEVRLSNEGLKGDGVFKYVASTTFSDDFMFFPDSMNTHSQRFEVEKQSTPVPFPDVLGDKTYVHWMPYDDELFASKENVPIGMFEDQATSHGTLVVRPDGLTGWGKMDINGSLLSSKLFKYKENIIDADTAVFSMKGLNDEDFSFRTENVNAHIDFTERLGVFKSNGEASFVEFTENQYICYMDQFNWYMDNEEIEVSASKSAQASQKPDSTLSPTQLEDVQLTGSRFISIHPHQDSLEFMAPSAKYSLRKNLISAKEVKWIRVGDARIDLDEKGEVVIEKKAKMRTLYNTVIWANAIDKYHRIYNAITDINGRFDYSSSGDYDYEDENQQKQKIHFDKIGLDSMYQTYGTGKINMSDNFKLSPYFEYTGKTKLFASNPYLTFDGYSRIVHECDTLKQYWINFEAEINPSDIYIPFYSDSTKDINGSVMSSGLYIFQDSMHLYTTFLSKKEFFSDIPVFPVSGYVYYDKKQGKFKISSKEKIIEQNLPGDYLSMHKSICNVFGEGTFKLGADLGRIEYNSVGEVSNNLVKNTYNFDMLMGVNFHFNEKCLDMVANAINSAEGLDGVDLNRKIYRKGLAELVGAETADRLISELAMGSFKKIPKELQYTFFFNELQMKWDPKLNSYISEGPIGVGSIGKTQVNRIVDGYVQVNKRKNMDKIYIYLNLDDTNYFFFYYALGKMMAYSTVDGFNTTISETKADDRKWEQSGDETASKAKYIYQLATPQQVKKFLKQFEEDADGEMLDEDGNPIKEEKSEDE